MKLVKMGEGTIGLLVQLPSGPYVVDILKSFGVFASHYPESCGILSEALREKCVWAAIVKRWSYLRKPLDLLARAAATNPDDPRVAISAFACERLLSDASNGIAAIDVTDVTDLALRDPTGRRILARSFDESVNDATQPFSPWFL